MPETEHKSKNNAIEFLRIIFTFAILLFHTFGTIDKATENYVYVRHARICVEFFFIISGYFLYKECLAEPSFKRMAMKKFFRLFPVVLAVDLVLAIGLHAKVSDVIPDFLLLSSIGIAQKASIAAYCWFMYPLFWISCFYFALNKIVKDDFKFNFIVVVLIYFSLVILSDNFIIFWDTKKTYYHIFNSGMLRAIVSIGLGFLVAKNLEFGTNITKKNRIFATLIELFTFGYLFANLFLIKAPHVVRSSVVYIALFCILFVCFIYKIGYVSQILDKIRWYYISKYCYSWYVSSCIPLLYFSKRLPAKVIGGQFFI